MDRRKVTIDCGMGVPKGYKIEVIDPTFEILEIDPESGEDNVESIEVMFQDDKGKFHSATFATVEFTFGENKATITATEDCEDKHLFLNVTFRWR